MRRLAQVQMRLEWAWKVEVGSEKESEVLVAGGKQAEAGGGSQSDGEA